MRACLIQRNYNDQKDNFFGKLSDRKFIGKINLKKIHWSVNIQFDLFQKLHLKKLNPYNLYD